MASRPVAEKLFTWPSDSPSLIGGRSKESGKLVFPLPEGAERDHFDAVELSRQGRLWSYTIQRFPPKSPPYLGDGNPETFKPYAVGYVELPGEIIVEARLDTDHFQALEVGMPMELSVIPFRTDESGNEIMTYAFRPAA